MIDISIKIGDGDKVDTNTAFGFTYAGSDNRFEAPIKEFQKTTYADQEGENIYHKTTSDAFDYVVKFFVSSDNIEDANDRIAIFNQSLYTEVEGVKEFKDVTIYNTYKKNLIVGIPSLIEVATDFWRDSKGNQSDKVMVDFKIRVSKPSLCNFNYSE